MSKIYHICICVIAILVLSGCQGSSAEKDGKEAAKAIVDCHEQYFNEREKGYEEIIHKLNNNEYTRRTEVREAVNKINEIEGDKFQQGCADAERMHQQLLETYSTDHKEKAEYLKAYSAYCREHNVDESELNSLLEQIKQLTRTIIPPIPVEAKISQDLVGKKIYDLESGYFGKDWAWTVQDLQGIKNVEILKKERDGERYKYTVALKLRDKEGTYLTTVILDYRLNDDDDDWTIDLLQTQKEFAMERTGRYDDCISAQITGIDYEHQLELRNLSDAELVVGGRLRFQNSNDWKKYLARIEANDTKKFGGLFIGSVAEYTIDFVERR